MTETFLLTREKDENDALAHQLKKFGIKGISCPMFSVKFLPCDFDSFQNVQCLAVTSKNGIRSITDIPHLKGPPLFTVGQATKELAEKEGFTKVKSAKASFSSFSRVSRND